MPSPRVQASDFVAASQRYVEKAVQRADRNQDGVLTARELRSLPKDLRDNAKNFAYGTNTLARVPGKVTPTRAALFSALERGVAKHDWKGLLPLFDKANRKGQSEIGVNDSQYLAEGLGLHMVNNTLDGPITRAETLDQLKAVKIGRTPTERTATSERYVGVATLQDGKRLQVDLYLKPVKGGFVIAPPVG